MSNVNFKIIEPKEDSEFWIKDTNSINAILKKIIEQSHVNNIIIYKNEENLFLSNIVFINKKTNKIYFDITENDKLINMIQKNENFLISFKDEGVEIVFKIDNFKIVDLDGMNTLCANIPNKIHRLQRRNYYRVNVSNKISFILNNNIVSSDLVDISLGGVSFLSKTKNQFMKNQLLKNCFININIDNKTEEFCFDLQVMHISEQQVGFNNVEKIGAKFLRLSPKEEYIINKYIIRQQQNSLTG